MEVREQVCSVNLHNSALFSTELEVRAVVVGLYACLNYLLQSQCVVELDRVWMASSVCI